MLIFVADIAGRPTLAFAARDYADALAFVQNDFIRSELASLRTLDGTPLLVDDADVVMREATDGERATWEKRLAEALEDQVFDSRQDAIECGCFAFLVEYRERYE